MNIISLEFATNFYGILSSEMKERLTQLIENPCEETWENAYSIIVNRQKCTNLWQAVLEIDKTYINHKGTHCKWHKIPSRETIIEAIKKAVYVQTFPQLN